MPADYEGGHYENGSADKTSNAAKPPSRSLLTIPPPLKRLFDRCPLIVYPQEDLPYRCPRRRNENALYIFTTPEDAAVGGPSFNPGCLKLQSFLKFRNIVFHTVPSSNHASPSGALPFRLPSTGDNHLEHHTPIPTSKLESWALSVTTSASAPTPKPAELYQSLYHSLLSRPIRLAYLHSLYIDAATFRSTTSPLYIHPASSSPLVRLSLEGPVRTAALTEVLNVTFASEYVSPRVDIDRLLRDADAAFGSLSVLLGDEQWFAAIPRSGSATPVAPNKRHTRASSRGDRGDLLLDELDPFGTGQRDSGFGLFDDDEDDGRDGGEARKSGGPGMLDAAVFAYTHVLLLLFEPNAKGCPAERLTESVRSRANLVEHRERILEQFFNEYQGRRRNRGGLKP